jgi:hypothetical protein
MTTSTLNSGKTYFTPAQANATLPLVRAIVHDIVELAQTLRDRHKHLGEGQENAATPAHREEQEQFRAEFERGQERMREFEQELEQLGVELKDYFMGLVDFPSLQDGKEVYLCWRLGEPEVAHWHPLDAGFTGRKKIRPPAGG